MRPPEEVLCLKPRSKQLVKTRAPEPWKERICAYSMMIIHMGNFEMGGVDVAVLYY